MTLSSEALDAIEAHAWPGNVRELENVDQARGHHGRELDDHAVDDIDIAPAATEDVALNLRQVRDEAEKAAVISVLGRANGNLSKAAELLGVSRPTLYDLMHRFGLR